MSSTGEIPTYIRKPHWLKRSLPSGPQYEKVRKLVHGQGLHTVCREAQCPNQFQCYGEGTATFLILGDRCTRNCGFCSVDHGPVALPDPHEPTKVAEAVAQMKLKYAVITSVTRDDLEDGGASHFAYTIDAIKKLCPETPVEILIPDFKGDANALQIVIDAPPDVLNHNIETVPRLYHEVRPEADYRRSLGVIELAKQVNPKMVTKSGIMLGLGETHEEMMRTMTDLVGYDCDILTLGQYLQPSTSHLPVQEYIHPDEFKRLEEEALSIGFKAVASSPHVRSSYRAEELYRQALL